MTKKPKRGTHPKLLTRQQLARELNYDPRTIQRLQEEGMPIAVPGIGGRPSQYDVRAVRKWLDARNKKAASTPGGKLSYFQERAEKERWQGLLAQQTYLTRQRELLPAREVEKVWAAEVTAVRTRLLSWPTTIADKLHRAGTMDGLAGLERVLQEEVHAVLTELSKGMHAAAAAVEESPHEVPAT